MNIREIKKIDEVKLKDFLLKLSSNTLHNWNRFGTKIAKNSAIKISKEQASKSKKQEIGFVAINDNGEIVGYSFLRFMPEKKQKEFTASVGVAVADKFQGQGIGGELLSSLLEFSKKKGLKKLWLTVYADNTKAISIYKKFGFEPEGVFMYDEYFNNKPRHIISMAKFLDKEIKNSSSLREKIMQDLLK